MAVYNFILLLLAFSFYDLKKYFIKKRSAGVLCLKTEKDIWRCKVCIRIMCLHCNAVPVTEKHCKDIFDLTGDTSHKPQVAMKQNLLHCISIKVSDGLKGIVIFIALSIIF